MSVSLIRATESHTGATLLLTKSVSEASFQWALGQAGDTPYGVLVFTFTMTTATETATAVTYGGQSLAKVTGGSAADTANEPGRCTAWFLGSGLPTGAQNVVVTRTNNTVVMYAVGFLLASGGLNTSVYGTPVLQEENAAMTAVTIDPGTQTSIVLAGAYYGGSTAPVGSTGTTTAQTIDGGTGYAYSCATGYETTPTTGSRSRGLAAATDDRAQVVLAVRELGLQQGAVDCAGASTLAIAGTVAHRAQQGVVAVDATTTLAVAGSVAHRNQQGAVDCAGASTLAVAGTVEGLIDYISIERKDGAEGDYAEVTKQAIDSSPWDDDGPFTGGHTYYYRARIYQQGAFGDYGNEDSIEWGALEQGALAVDAATTVAVAGSIAHRNQQGAVACDAATTVAIAAGVQHAAWTGALALAAATTLAVAGTTAHRNQQGATSVDATTTAAIAGTVAHRNQQGAVACDATTTAAIAGTVSGAPTGAMAVACTTTLAIAGTVAHVAHQGALTVTATTTVAIVGTLAGRVQGETLVAAATTVAAAGSVVHVNRQGALAIDATTGVTPAGTVAHRAQQGAMAPAAATTVAIAGTRVKLGAAAPAATSGVAVAGTTTHATWQGAAAPAATSGVATAGTVSHAAWQGALACAATTGVQVAGQTEGEFQGSFAVAAITTVKVRGYRPRGGQWHYQRNDRPGRAGDRGDMTHRRRKDGDRGGGKNDGRHDHGRRQRGGGDR